MKHLIFAACLVLGLTQPVYGQVLVGLPVSAAVVTSIRLGWEQTLASTAGVAEVMTYRVYDVLTPPTGAATTTATILEATCAPAAPPVTVPPSFTCTSAALTLARGNHSLTLTAENALGEGPKSTPVATGPPTAPRNPRIVVTVLVDIP